MTGIIISIKARAGREAVSRGAAAQIRRVDDGYPQAAWYWQGSIPVGGPGRPIEIPGAGTYRIEVALPSGTKLVEHARVGADETSTVTLVVPDRSGRIHGTIGVGRAAERGAPASSKASLAPADIIVRGIGGRDRPLEVGPRAEKATWEQGSRPVLKKFSVDPTAVWAVLGKARAEGLRSAASNAMEKVPGTAASIKTKQPGCWGVRRKHGASRVFAVCDKGENVEIASLPLPGPDGTGFDTVEITTSEGGACNLDISVRDSLSGWLLAYVGAGDMGAAGVVLADIASVGGDGRLETLSKRPLAAAAAAYVVASGNAGGDADRWSDWLYGLSDRFAWMPDIAIACGRRQLRLARTGYDVGNAAAFFKHAYDLGLPYFAAGVGALSDGLVLVASEDSSLKAPAKCVAEVRLLVDPRHTFTVVRAAARAP